MKRARLAALTLAFAMAWTPMAMAQDTGPPPPADETVAPPPPPPDDGRTPPPPPVVIVDDAPPVSLTGREDRPRFRWGISLQGGALMLPVLTAEASSSGSVSVREETLWLNQIGVVGQVGMQINDLVGVYLKPSIDVMWGDVAGMHLSLAIMGDFTFLDGLLTAGVGFDMGGFFGFGGSIVQVDILVGDLYGARLHFAVHPFVGEDAPPGPGRKGFSIGIDMRLLGGAVAKASTGVEGAAASAGTEFFFSPMFTIGYTDF